VLDEKSLEFIIRKMCDKLGSLRYMNVIKNLVIITKQDENSGLISTKWLIRQALPDAHKATSSCTSLIARSSTSATTLHKMEDTPREMEAATRKVIIKKKYNDEAVQKIFNLKAVSATCQRLNL
jgi:hypothetical protein